MKSNELRFLIDMGVGVKVEQLLQELGYNVKTIRKIDPFMSDSNILNLASSEGRVIITMDKDFGELVYHFQEKHCGILLLRLEEATGTEKQLILSKILEKHSKQIKNHFSVFKNNKFRSRTIKKHLTTQPIKSNT